MSFGPDSPISKHLRRDREITSKLVGDRAAGLIVDPLGFGDKPDRFTPPPAPSPPPTEQSAEVSLARKNARERMLRSQGRAASQVTTPGLLAKKPSINKPVLSDTLG